MIASSWVLLTTSVMLNSWEEDDGDEEKEADVYGDYSDVYVQGEDVEKP
jgi:hypothetical protein